MFWVKAVCRFLLVLPSLALPMYAQKEKAPPGTDVIVFANGDQLTGTFLREAAGSVVFKSDIAGEVTVTWDEVKSIRTSKPFAVIQQGQHVTRKTPDADVPQGAIKIEEGQVTVTPSSGTSKDIPVKNAEYVIDQPTFVQELRSSPGFFSRWTS